jgi:hypothetical protein
VTQDLLGVFVEFAGVVLAAMIGAAAMLMAARARGKRASVQSGDLRLEHCGSREFARLRRSISEVQQQFDLESKRLRRDLAVLEKRWLEHEMQCGDSSHE